MPLLPTGNYTNPGAEYSSANKNLTYHVVPGKLMKAELAKLSSVTSVEGSPIKIDCSDGFEVKMQPLARDIEADNGVIHVIDTVILMVKSVLKQKWGGAPTLLSLWTLKEVCA